MAAAAGRGPRLASAEAEVKVGRIEWASAAARCSSGRRLASLTPPARARARLAEGTMEA